MITDQKSSMLERPTPAGIIQGVIDLAVANPLISIAGLGLAYYLMFER